MNTKFNIICLASDFSKHKIQFYINKYSSYLENIGGHFCEQESHDSTLPNFYFIISGGTENQLIEIVNSKTSKNKIYLLSHSEDNSLPASFEIMAKLDQDEIPAKMFFFDNCNIEKTIVSIKDEIKNIEVKNRLSHSKIGLIGKPSDWLIASSSDKETIKNVWGSNILEIPLEEIYTKFSDSIYPENACRNSNKFIESSKSIIEPSNNEITDAAKIYNILKSIAKKNKLDALTIRCFDIVLKLKTTGCYALAQLSDEGIISGCEGDLVSTLGMLWSYYLTDEIPWMANPSNFNITESTINIAHCTVPMKLLEQYSIRSHFESDLGVAIEGKMPKKEITLLRIGGKKLDKLWVAEGKIIENTNFTNYCRTQVKIKLNNSFDLEDLINNPLGNHLVMIYGKHSTILKNYFNDYVITY
jgi:L-fucose isomerase-like protein